VAVAVDWNKEGPWGIGALLIGLASCLPFLWVLPLGAMSRDAVLWVERSQVHRPRFSEWIFQTQHFNVGYRPVTGLSYAVNDLVGGYRATDLLLHALCALLVYVVYRRLAPTLPRFGGLVSAAVMAAHPLGEFVVPHLARRGYPLATAWSLAGLALLTARGPARWLGPLCIAGAALSNDAAYATFVLGALLVIARDRDRGLLAALAATLLVVVAARTTVVGGVGGYQVDDRWERVVPILFATWDRLLPFFGAIELPMSGGRTAVAALGLLALAGAAGWAVSARDDTASAIALAGAWLVGLTLLFLPNGVWFPRQVYLLIAPMALLVGMLVAKAPGGDALAWVRAAPALAIVAAVLARSPLWSGTDPVQRRAWVQTEAIVTELIDEASEVKRRDDIYVVVPFFKRPGQAGLRARDPDERRRRDPLGARIVEMRAENLLGRAKQLHTAALVFADPDDPAPYLTLDADASPPEVQAEGRARLSIYVGELTTEGDEGGRGHLDLDEGWLFVHDGVEGRRIAVPPRP